MRGVCVSILVLLAACPKSLDEGAPCAESDECRTGLTCVRHRCARPSATAKRSSSAPRQVTITLVPSDHRGLACRMDAEVGGLHCAFRADGSPRAGAATPFEDDALLQPVTTDERESLLVAGLWTQPAVRERARGPEVRFLVACSVEQKGAASGAQITWELGQKWQEADGWPVVVARGCRVR